MKNFLLCSPESGEGGSPAAEPVEPAAPSSPSPALPPAANQVKHSDAKESDAGEIVALKRALEDERAARKKEQIRLAELEDAHTRRPPQERAPEKKGWLDGILD